MFPLAWPRALHSNSLALTHPCQSEPANSQTIRVLECLRVIHSFKKYETQYGSLVKNLNMDCTLIVHRMGRPDSQNPEAVLVPCRKQPSRQPVRYWSHLITSFANNHPASWQTKVARLKHQTFTQMLGCGYCSTGRLFEFAEYFRSLRF